MLKYHALKFLRENKRQSIYVLQMALEEDKRKGVSKPRKSQGFKKKNLRENWLEEDTFTNQIRGSFGHDYCPLYLPIANKHQSQYQHPSDVESM